MTTTNKRQALAGINYREELWCHVFLSELRDAEKAEDDAKLRANYAGEKADIALAEFDKRFHADGVKS